MWTRTVGISSIATTISVLIAETFGVTHMGKIFGFTGIGSAMVVLILLTGKSYPSKVSNKA